MAIYGGGNTYVVYQVESTFGTSPGWTTAGNGKHFGQGVKLSNIKRTNNVKPVWGLGSRATQAVVQGTWAGSFDLEFCLANHCEWLGAIYGDDASIHIPTAPNKGLSILVATDPTLGTNTLWAQLTVFSGCLITNAKISMEAGENPVMVTLSIIYKSELSPIAANKLLSTYAIPTASYDPKTIYSFGQIGTRNIGGTTTYIVERGEVTLSSNSKFVYGLGSRAPQGNVDAPIEFTGNFKCIKENETLLVMSYDGDTTTATGPANDPGPISACVFTMTNGDGSVTFTFYKDATPAAGAFVTDYTDNAEIGEALGAEIGIMGTSIQVTTT